MKFRNSRLLLLQVLLSDSRSAFHSKSAKLLVAAALVCAPFTLAVNSTVQNRGPWARARPFATNSEIHPVSQRAGSTVAFRTTIQWTRQRGVTRYRLQIAADETFKNVFYDGLVTGERYTVSNLLPGYYFWRVVPANFQNGSFFGPVRFFVSGGMITSAGARDYQNRPR